MEKNFTITYGQAKMICQTFGQNIDDLEDSEIMEVIDEAVDKLFCDYLKA